MEAERHDPLRRGTLTGNRQLSDANLEVGAGSTDPYSPSSLTLEVCGDPRASLTRRHTAAGAVHWEAAGQVCSYWIRT